MDAAAPGAGVCDPAVAPLRPFEWEADVTAAARTAGEAAAAGGAVREPAVETIRSSKRGACAPAGVEIAAAGAAAAPAAAIPEPAWTVRVRGGGARFGESFS